MNLQSQALENKVLSAVLFFTAFILCNILNPTSAIAQQVYDIGFRVDPSKLDDPDFYFSKTESGEKIQDIYETYGDLRRKPLDKLPYDFNPVIQVIHEHILENSEQNNPRSQFYVGKNGEKNGPEFNFSKDKLPTKIAKLSFCFGFDPFVFTGILRQESHFKRTARSHTGAAGFAQLTSAAIAEVSEQLGIIGPAYHGENAPELFGQFIQCYLGPNKTWVNMWEDGTIPADADAYKNGKIKSGRDWLYVTKSKTWLNADADRNLIYGAILFKLYLGHFGSYSKALTQYNVSHPGVYTGRVNKFYGQMQDPFNDQVPELEEIIVYGKKTSITSNGYVLKLDDSQCVISTENIANDIFLANTIDGLYTKDEVNFMLKDLWTRKGYCRPTTYKT